MVYTRYAVKRGVPLLPAAWSTRNNEHRQRNFGLGLQHEGWRVEPRDTEAQMKADARPLLCWREVLEKRMVRQRVHGVP